MNKFLLSFLITCSISIAQEVSVFGAGNLDSKNPYGLNSAEKHILKNQKNLNNVTSKVNDVNSSLEDVKNRLEGLSTIYEGDSAKLNSTVIKLNGLIKKLETSSIIVTKNSEDITELKSVTEQFITIKEESDKLIQKNITEISKLVNKINSRYVSESEFKSNMKQFVTRSEFEALKKLLNVKSKPSVTSNKKLTGKDKKQLMDEAKKQYEKQYFKYAIPKFEKLISLNYKPAESNFYLGQMWYVRKKYDLAISHYKKSAMLYDQAAYMPTLLLHSAISFEKIKDRENAKSFYNTLIDLYPDSKETKIAVQNLSKL